MTPFIYSFTVTKDAIDFNGHVNNVTYLSWMISAATKHSESVGSSYEKCLELGGTWVAKSHTIEYKKPAFENDELQMKTWIEDIGKILSTRRYELTRPTDGALICEGKTEWVFVDSKKMRPMKIPQDIIDGFRTRH
ncbi:acyl-CoA thioesterase [Sulfurovum sp. CS9]|uniref:acyl-CoA thioesterase n=1 Tax=Sulfurovum sp. CS9 TaxID=3391146 RepID=UPI0039EB333E